MRLLSYFYLCYKSETIKNGDLVILFCFLFFSLVSAFSQKNKTYKMGLRVCACVCVCVSVCVRVLNDLFIVFCIVIIFNYICFDYILYHTLKTWCLIILVKFKDCKKNGLAKSSFSLMKTFCMYFGGEKETPSCFILVIF